jgi:hypothetical protein
VLRAVALALAVSLLLAACGSDEEAAPAPAPPVTTIVTEAPPSADLTPEQLPGLALALTDLPPGFTVRREGYVEASGEVVGDFRRYFDPGTSALGESLLADLSSDVALFSDEEAAQDAIGGILAALLGDQVEAAFADLVLHSVGIEATNIEGETLASRDIGESAVIARATFDTEAGLADAIFVLVLVGRLHHALFLIGPPGDVQLEDAEALARAVVPRLQQATGSIFAA